MEANSDVPAIIDSERDFVILLLKLYRENSLLWDTTKDDYTNKYRRHVALNNICNALKVYRPNYTVQELKRKLNILRTNFNKERNKIEKRKAESVEGEAEPILWYYNEMTFLIGQEAVVKRTAPSVANKKPPHPKLIRRLKRPKISIITDPLKSKDGLDKEEEILAQCWAMKLKKLTAEQRLYAEKIINDTLFEAELGTLTRHGATFNSEPVAWVGYSSEDDGSTFKCPKGE
ncbi:uncharacterized protein LOC142982728 [Anticarsia gemmatalis]|uniref:uncharacterized protein LOC142982728 n=1 Tax=Anticarsia gemmatalis TaxID=129554 RepID=UPI003F76C503